MPKKSTWPTFIFCHKSRSNGWGVVRTQRCLQTIGWVSHDSVTVTQTTQWQSHSDTDTVTDSDTDSEWQAVTLSLRDAVTGRKKETVSHISVSESIRTQTQQSLHCVCSEWPVSQLTDCETDTESPKPETDWVSHSVSVSLWFGQATGGDRRYLHAMVVHGRHQFKKDTHLKGETHGCKFVARDYLVGSGLWHYLHIVQEHWPSSPSCQSMSLLEMFSVRMQKNITDKTIYYA